MGGADDVSSSESSALERTAEVSKSPVASPTADPSPRPSSTTPSSSSPTAEAVVTTAPVSYNIGDEIEGKYLDGNEWLVGVISGVHEKTGTYDIRYLDAEEEEKEVETKRIRVHSTALTLEEEEENRRWQAEEDETNRLLALEKENQGKYEEKEVDVGAANDGGKIEEKKVKIEELPEFLSVGMEIV